MNNRPRLEYVALAGPAKRGELHIRKLRWGRSDCKSPHPQPIVFSSVPRPFTQPRAPSIFTPPRSGDRSQQPRAQALGPCDRRKGALQGRCNLPAFSVSPCQHLHPASQGRSQPTAQGASPGSGRSQKRSPEGAMQLTRFFCVALSAHPLDSGRIPGLAAWVVNCGRPCGANSSPRLAGTAEPARVARREAVG